MLGVARHANDLYIRFYIATALSKITADGRFRLQEETAGEGFVHYCNSLGSVAIRISQRATGNKGNLEGREIAGADSGPFHIHVLVFGGLVTGDRDIRGEIMV